MTNNIKLHANVSLPIAVHRIVKKLEDSGFEAYAVGGCVRDTLLDRAPDDWDITTSATPMQVKKLFRRTVDTGLQHGTVTVLMGGDDTLTAGYEGYEVTTYRIDGAYEDGRHPSEVTFTPSLHEDLARRDFTINAMAMNESQGIVDDFGGMEDLEKGIIRAVGDPVRRFTEDALRMLRALRFSAQLGFNIEEETMKAAKKLAPNLQKVSKERIAVELTKLLMSDNPDKIREVFSSGLSAYVSDTFKKLEQASIPELSKELPHIRYVRWGSALSGISADPELADTTARKLLRELKLDNDIIKKTGTLVSLLNFAMPTTEESVRRTISSVGGELFLDYLDTLAVLKHQDVEEPRKYAELIISRGDCISISMLALSGQDLIREGIPQGPELGRMLGMMLDDVLAEPTHNTREYLLDFYKNHTIHL